MTHRLSGMSALSNLPILRKFRRRRASSHDRSGGNDDRILLMPGERRVIFDVDGPGCITHLWATFQAEGAPHAARHLILRIWWDGEASPSVECPLGDFFGLGHGELINFVSEPLQMSPEGGKALNSWWPMPFQRHARIEVENDNPGGLHLDINDLRRGLRPGVALYYYIDYELHDALPGDDEEPLGYFHSQFRRVDYARDERHDPETGRKLGPLEWQFNGGKNTRANGGYDKNHVILSARGRGQYVGCHINIHNRRRLLPYNWPGEGDDMIFIDDDVGGEPTLYGTGTEDYVNTAWCPQEKYSAPYHGILKGGGDNWSGKVSYYRYHVRDPIAFERQILVTMEHGHNNSRGDIWETTAYWYQTEPHDPFPPLPDRRARTPLTPRRPLLPSRPLLSLAHKALMLKAMLDRWRSR